ERRERDRRDQDERAHAEEDLHRSRIARFAATQRPRELYFTFDSVMKALPKDASDKFPGVNCKIAVDRGGRI
ncbi:MAG TPA: hypothetical protein VFS91_02425, partial [Nitrobacter sp.]|nr:hypothetical protein [Nitrobacter sp.]